MGYSGWYAADTARRPDRWKGGATTSVPRVTADTFEAQIAFATRVLLSSRKELEAMQLAAAAAAAAQEGTGAANHDADGDDGDDDDLDADDDADDDDNEDDNDAGDDDDDDDAIAVAAAFAASIPRMLRDIRPSYFRRGQGPIANWR